MACTGGRRETAGNRGIDPLKIQVVMLMGVCGTGKSTVGRLLAQRLAWPFFDGDDFHPEANRKKMESGQPLDDDDRRPWLEALRDLIRRRLTAAGPAVLACSALKQSYRQLMVLDDPRILLVHLTGPPEILAQRLRLRRDHFMPPGLLGSQLQILEPPGGEALTLDVEASPETLCDLILEAMETPRAAAAVER